MSLLKYAVAAAIGYFAGQPDGRRQLERLRHKAAEVVRSPQVEDLKQRGKDIAGERASTVLDRVRHKGTESSTAGEASGFGGGGVHGYRSLEGTFLGGCLFSGRVAGRSAAR
mgnify:CR=1 FL=1